MKVVFSIPTSLYRPGLLAENLAILDKQCSDSSQDCKIHVISDKTWNIAAKYNAGARAQSEFDFICFMHDDIRIEHPNWIDYCVNKEFAGLQKHTKPYFYDGALWASKKVWEKIGCFDEKLIGERETEDFCYRAKLLDINIEPMIFMYRHFNSGLNHIKDPIWCRANPDPSDIGKINMGYVRSVMATRAYFKDKWNLSSLD